MSDPLTNIEQAALDIGTYFLGAYIREYLGDDA